MWRCHGGSFFWSKRAEEKVLEGKIWEQGRPKAWTESKKEHEKQSQTGNFLSAAGINVDFPGLIP